MKRQQSVFRRYLLYFVVVITIAVLASGLTNLVFQYQLQQQAISRSLRLEVDEARGAIRDFLDTLVHDIRHHMRWTRWPFHPGGLQVTRLEFLLLLRQSPAITDLMLLDAAGHERLLVSRVAMDRIDSQRDLSKRPAFQQAADDRAWFGPVYYRKETEPFMDIALRSGSDDQATVTIAAVNLRFLWDRLPTASGHHPGQAFIIDREGRLLAHPDPLAPLGGTDMDRMPQVVAALRSAAASGPAGGYREGHDLDGNTVLSRYARVGNPDWLVFAEQRRDTALAPLLAALSRTGLMLLFGLLLAVAAGTLLARYMTAPIRTLQRGVEAFASGNLEHRIQINTGDELETLAAACNHMAQQIRNAHRDLEDKVRQRTHALDAANRHKSEFLAAMSHELRTPLNSVIGFSEALEMRLFGELNRKQTEYVHDIHEAGQHLLQLINDLLDLSKVEAGQMELELIDLDMDKLIPATSMLVRTVAAKRGIELALEIEPGLAPIKADERRLKQVLLNLLSNALKFTPRGGRIVLQAEAGDAGIIIRCRDTGIGIAKADQAAVFDAFHQVRSPRAGHPEGTGLGLALTRRLVEMHGGTVELQSSPGKGSTFSISLPNEQ